MAYLAKKRVRSVVALVYKRVAVLVSTKCVYMCNKLNKLSY